MDAQAKKKALFRAKLNAQKQEKQRIGSPLVRYNEHDQPVCRVCDVIIKSESLWPAHQASRKHHEAIDNLKANAAALNRQNNLKADPAKELPKPTPESNRELPDKSEHLVPLPTHRKSALPPDFFDNQETKRKKTERDFSKSGDRDSLKVSVSTKSLVAEAGISQSGTDISSIAKAVPKATAGSEATQVKGALPQGFFDDKDADLRARGITPVKPDVKDEYKEFEKLIQEDLQEIDNRLEEEEFDAANTIEEEESVEQRAYIERVERLRRKKLELRASKPAAAAAAAAEGTETTLKESKHEDSSSDEEYNENFTVDWRAKHL